jgi:hypothetical protein
VGRFAAGSSGAIRSKWLHDADGLCLEMEGLSLILLLGAMSVTASVVLGDRCHCWWMTESGIAILIGMFVGLLWYLSEEVYKPQDLQADTSNIKLFVRTRRPNLGRRSLALFRAIHSFATGPRS